MASAIASSRSSDLRSFGVKFSPSRSTSGRPASIGCRLVFSVCGVLRIRWSVVAVCTISVVFERLAYDTEYNCHPGSRPIVPDRAACIPSLRGTPGTAGESGRFVRCGDGTLMGVVARGAAETALARSETATRFHLFDLADELGFLLVRTAVDGARIRSTAALDDNRTCRGQGDRSAGRPGGGIARRQRLAVQARDAAD